METTPVKQIIGDLQFPPEIKRNTMKLPIIYESDMDLIISLMQNLSLISVSSVPTKRKLCF